MNKSYPSVNYFQPVIAPETQLDELGLTTKFKTNYRQYFPYIMAILTLQKI